MNSQAMTLRSATPADIPAMLSILLTSFRDFPLFDFVYSPLNQNIEHASDTIFFWGRRIEAAIYDPQSDVVVAECSPLSLDSTDAPTHNPSEMLNWVVSTGKLSQISTETGQLVVAFAIWRWKGGALSSNKIDTTRASLDYLKGLRLKLESRIYSICYDRKDQDKDRYAAYALAETDHEKKFYKMPCLNLDNLCVDFRTQRHGVGRALVQWGILKADEQNIPIQTETSQQASQFYQRLDFHQIGKWQITVPKSTEDITLIVMKRNPS